MQVLSQFHEKSRINNCPLFIKIIIHINYYIIDSFPQVYAHYPQKIKKVIHNYFDKKYKLIFKYLFSAYV